MRWILFSLTYFFTSLCLILTWNDYYGSKATFQLKLLTNDNRTWGVMCMEPCNRFGDGSYSYEGEMIISSFDKTTYDEGEVITGTFHFETDDDNGKFSVTNGIF